MSEKQLTGRHVLLILLAFFGVMLSVNIYFTIVAVTSFRGEDVPRSYRQGLEYNQTLAAREKQARSGWTAGVNSVRVDNRQHKILVEMKDRADRGIRGLHLQAKLRHPVDTDFDREIIFSEIGNGVYASGPQYLSGHWQLEADIPQVDFVFKIRHELWAN